MAKEGFPVLRGPPAGGKGLRVKGGGGGLLILRGDE